jgi:hypothetical protein
MKVFLKTLYSMKRRERIKEGEKKYRIDWGNENKERRREKSKKGEEEREIERKL